MSSQVWAGLAVAIPTFRRVDMLQRLLCSIEKQTVLPALILVIDNNPDSDARVVVEGYDGPLKLEYLPRGKNTGPAGALSTALSHLAEHPSKPEWMLCRDDDNPFAEPDIIARLRALSSSAPASAAAVGIYGIHYFPRAEVPKQSPFRVDVIPGSGGPTYNIANLARAGLSFNEWLFFGYEEMELGLRIRQANLPMIVEQLKPAMYIDSDRAPTDWRSYFGERNWLIVSRQVDPFHKFLYFVLRAIGSSAKKLVRGGQRTLAIASFLGAIDGMRGSKPRPFYIPR